MDQGPLVNEEVEAGAELARHFQDYKPIKAVFWLRASGEDQRYLYLSSDQIDDTNFDLAYGEVSRLAYKIDSPDLDPFRVKVIGGQNPLTLAAVEINRRFPGRAPIRLGGGSFGGISVDDVYVYPSPLPVGVGNPPVMAGPSL